MKRLFVLLLVLAMVFTFSACGTSSEDEPTGAEDQETTEEAASGTDAGDGSSGDMSVELSEELLKSGTVSEIMESVKADDLELVSNLYSGEEVACILNEAVKDEITEDEAVTLGAVLEPSEEEPNESLWTRFIDFHYGDDKIASVELFGNDKTDVTGVEVGNNGNIRIAFYRNEGLFDLMRNAREAELTVDKDAFDKYGAKVLESAEACFDSEKDDMGLTDIKLVHFEKVWEGKDDPGNELSLYDWEYSVGVEKPEETMLAAGMRFDYEMRLRTFNGYYGQLAVKENNGEVLNTALIVNDEMVWPEEGNADAEEFVRNRVLEKLD